MKILQKHNQKKSLALQAVPDNPTGTTVRLRSHSYASESGILHLFPSRGHHKVGGRGVTRATLAVKMWWREH